MPRSRQQILKDIAAIREMDRGKVIVCREGRDNPRLKYYAQSSYEQGRSRLRYLRKGEKEAMEVLVAEYTRFRALVQEYETWSSGKRGSAALKTKPPNEGLRRRATALQRSSGTGPLRR